MVHPLHYSCVPYTPRHYTGFCTMRPRKGRTTRTEATFSDRDAAEVSAPASSMNASNRRIGWLRVSIWGHAALMLDFARCSCMARLMHSDSPSVSSSAFISSEDQVLAAHAKFVMSLNKRCSHASEVTCVQATHYWDSGN
jgi:hypothetical protein